MNEHLRERILRKLETLPDERAYQVLDYVEFLESRFAERQQPANAFTRFSEAVEDRLRAGKVSAAAIAETMGLLNRAANVLNGAVAAGKSVANDIVTAAQGSGPRASGAVAAGSTAAPGTPVATPGTSAPAAESPGPAREVAAPGAATEQR